MKNIRYIVKEKLCVGCGICESIAGKANIRMTLGDDGFYFPLVVGSVEGVFPEIRKICPGLKVLQKEKAKNDQEKLWGPIRASAIGFSTDAQIRYISSSGGAISSMLCYLLETTEVTGVVHVGRSENEALSNEAYISRTKSDIIRRAGSRYSPASPLVSIKQILSDKKERIAFVGKPCDVAALRAFLDLRPAFKNQVIAMFSFFCAGTPSQHGTFNLLSTLETHQFELEDFRYRGHGWPGKTTAILKNGTVKTMNYSESWGNILNKYLHFRCKFCPDGIGALGDISCGDAWQEISGYPNFEELPGQSLIIARTQKGEEILREAQGRGYICCDSYDISALGRIQVYQQKRKRIVAARILALRLTGRRHPKFKGFYLLHNSLRAGFKENVNNFIGMLKRIRKINAQ